jgi:hypothetical protein
MTHINQITKTIYGKIYISADKRRGKTFIKCAKKAAESKNFEAVYPPSYLGNSYYTLLDKILHLLMESEMIVMDVTPYRCSKRHWQANPGVLIEYGIIVGIKKTDATFLFIDESVPVDVVHPFIKHKEIIKYSPNRYRKLVDIIKTKIDYRIKYALKTIQGVSLYDIYHPHI